MDHQPPKRSLRVPGHPTGTALHRTEFPSFDSFGAWLRHLRLVHGLDQATLAAQLGYTVESFRVYESGRRRASKAFVDALAGWLALDAQQRGAFVTFARRTLPVDGQSHPLVPAWLAEVTRRPPRAALPPTNLPAPPGSLVGRDDDLPRVLHQLQGQSVALGQGSLGIRRVGRRGRLRPVQASGRLLTLVGPPGVGKTRLALEVGALVHEAFADGVWFVDLAPLTEPALVLPALAQCLGLRETGGRSLLEVLQEALRSKRLLVILDNFEQVLSAAVEVDALVATCPSLWVLVTSRERLRLRRERVCSINPLTLPRLDPLPGSAALARVPAVAFFVERAQQATGSSVLDEGNARAVADLCHRLDGLPLAIELAAAQADRFAPHELLQQVERRLEGLTEGAQDLPPRQQTLRAALAWSYDLLAPREQRLFRWLGVFVAGGGLEAVRAVCLPETSENRVARGAPDQIEEEALLESLRDKSLVRLGRVAGRSGGVERRVAMLETLREYALEALTHSGEAEAIRLRHATYYLAMAERAEPELRGADQSAWLARLEQEHDNCRAVLTWALESGDTEIVEIGLRLAAALWRFWIMRGHLTEGSRWLTQLLPRCRHVDASLRAKALAGAGILARNQGDYDAAWTLLEESKALCQQVGDDQQATVVWNALAFIASRRGDHATAQALFDEGLTLARARGDRRDIATLLTDQAFLAFSQSAYETARIALEEALALHRELGDKRGMSLALNGLGTVASERGDHAVARAFFDETRILAQESGDKLTLASSLNNLGILAGQQGEDSAARAYLEESLALKRELGDKQGIANTLTNLGLAARHQGDSHAARTFLEEALVTYQVLGDKRHRIDALNGLGQVALDRGDHALARACYTESLALSDEMGAKQGIADTLEGLARLAMAEDQQPARATQRLGVAAALRHAIGAPLPDSDQADVEAVQAAARTALGEASFVAAWTTGQAMPLEEIIAQTLQEAAS